jgi:hypothetical protein
MRPGRIRLGFAGNADRLLAAKRRYDPDAIFTAIAALLLDRSAASSGLAMTG